MTHKQAHKMMKRIRTELMNDEDDEPLSGDVEIDESSWGGKPRGAKPRFGLDRPVPKMTTKTTVLGMVERGGRLRFRVIPTRYAHPLVEPCWRT